MAPPGYRSRLQQELAQKTRASAGLRQVELDEHLLAAASRTSASALSISDLAQAIADEFKIRQRGDPQARQSYDPARGSEAIYGAR